MQPSSMMFLNYVDISHFLKPIYKEGSVGISTFSPALEIVGKTSEGKISVRVSSGTPEGRTILIDVAILGKESIQVLVSVPKFSTHEITIAKKAVPERVAIPWMLIGGIVATIMVSLILARVGLGHRGSVKKKIKGKKVR